MFKKKEIRNGKDEESGELIRQSRKQEQVIKKDRGSISHFERRKRMFKIRLTELDQLIKLSKR